MLHPSFNRVCLFSSLFPRQAKEDSSSLPLPRPHVKKNISTSFQDDTSVPCDEISFPGKESSIKKTVLTKRKTTTEAMVQHGSSPANSAAANEAEVFKIVFLQDDFG